MGRSMTEQEWLAFIAYGTRTGKLATTRADGRPHVTPVWFVLDDHGRLVLTTSATSLKGRAITRDPRVCLCVDEETPPYSFVMVEGDAQASEDLDEMLIWATRIGGRYMGADQAEQFGQRNAVPGELLVRITPTKVVSEAGVAE